MNKTARIQKAARGAWVFLLAAGAAQGHLPAQSTRTLVLPPTLATQEGSSSTNFPFGRGTPFRLQEIYWRPCFPGKPREIVLTRIAFRAEGGVKNKPKPFVSLSLYLSSTPRPFGRPSKKFRENRGKDWTLVYTGVTHLPSTPGTTPNPFDIIFPLEVPFTYATEREGLLLEIEVAKQPKGDYPLDSPYRCTSRRSLFGGNTSCRTSAGKPLLLGANSSIKLGGNLVLTLSQAPPEASALAFVGVRDKGKFYQGTLPLDLTPYGAPYCSLLVAPLLAKAGQTNKAGTASFNFRLPVEGFEIVGRDLLAQALVGDLVANQLGLVFSPGLRAQVCGPQPVGRIFSPGTVKAEEGWVQMGSAHILQLTLR